VIRNENLARELLELFSLGEAAPCVSWRRPWLRLPLGWSG
jgi:hypothetical protein